MKKILIAMMALMSLSSFAQNTTYVIAKGTVLAETSFERSGWAGFSWVTKQMNVDTKLNLSIFAEGKVKGNVIFDIQKKCRGNIAFDFIGIDQGLGEYDLYANSTELLKGVNKIGTLVDYGTEISLNLKSDFKHEGQHNRASCHVVIQKSAGIILEKK